MMNEIEGTLRIDVISNISRKGQLSQLDVIKKTLHLNCFIHKKI